MESHFHDASDQMIMGKHWEPMNTNSKAFGSLRVFRVVRPTFARSLRFTMTGIVKHCGFFTCFSHIRLKKRAKLTSFNRVVLCMAWACYRNGWDWNGWGCVGAGEQTTRDTLTDHLDLIVWTWGPPPDFLKTNYSAAAFLMRRNLISTPILGYFQTGLVCSRGTGAP